MQLHKVQENCRRSYYLHSHPVGAGGHHNLPDKGGEFHSAVSGSGLKCERHVEVALVEPLHLPLLSPCLSARGEEVPSVIMSRDNKVGRHQVDHSFGKTAIQRKYGQVTDCYRHFVWAEQTWLLCEVENTMFCETADGYDVQPF